MLLNETINLIFYKVLFLNLTFTFLFLIAIFNFRKKTLINNCIIYVMQFTQLIL